jgi:hypothetical protein
MNKIFCLLFDPRSRAKYVPYTVHCLITIFYMIVLNYNNYNLIQCMYMKGDCLIPLVCKTMNVRTKDIFIIYFIL